MKRSVTLIIAPLLALLTAIAVRQMLRARQSVDPQPNGAEATVERTQAKIVEESASHQNSTPTMSQAAEASPQQVEPTSLLGTGNTSVSTHLRPIYEAIKTSYASTVAAFALHGEEADYETHDAQAQQDADRLQQLFSSMRADLSPELTSVCEAIIDRIASAQLQLMAFAINRKNRGLPDSAQVEAELADRGAFLQDAAPLLERLRASLSKADVTTSERSTARSDVA